MPRLSLILPPRSATHPTMNAVAIKKNAQVTTEATLAALGADSTAILLKSSQKPGMTAATTAIRAMTTPATRPSTTAATETGM